MVPSFSAAALIVASSDLAAGMPRRLAERFRKMMPLRLAELPGAPLRFGMQLIWHQRTHQDPAAVAFRTLISRALSCAIADGRLRSAPGPLAAEARTGPQA